MRKIKEVYRKMIRFQLEIKYAFQKNNVNKNNPVEQITDKKKEFETTSDLSKSFLKYKGAIEFANPKLKIMKQKELNSKKIVKTPYSSGDNSLVKKGSNKNEINPLNTEGTP